MNISEQELQIFSRHLILKEFNEKLFNDLQKKKITIVGLGGIGCPAAQYLVAAGIKILKLIDGDLIQKTNLNRQILYSIYDIGNLLQAKALGERKKAISCYKKAIQIQPNHTNAHWCLHSFAPDIDEALKILKKSYRVNNRFLKNKIMISALQGFKGCIITDRKSTRLNSSH